ncbi:MAG: DUF2510 domain-containing protein [Salinibacterium sp.]|nr:MAG: DUF2510 domain-containing protein [Salinibacterium sp.]
MSDGTQTTPPAGWFADPRSSEHMRWWDGTQWTAHTQPRPQAAPPAAVAVAESTYVAQAPAQPQPEREGYVPMSRGATGGSGYSSLVRGAEPFRVPAPVSVGQIASPHTVPIWLFVLYPLVYAVLLGFLYNSGQLVMLALQGCILVGCWVLVIMDYIILRHRGFSAATPLWLFLTPIGYLIARRVVLRSQGAKPGGPGLLFASSLLFAGVLGALFGPGIVAQSSNPALVQEFERRTEAELAAKSPGNWTVDCPDDAKIFKTGETFVCHTDNGQGVRVDVTITVLGGGKYSTTARQI